MPMASTREQRITASIKIGLLNGLSEEDATARAYRAEGLEPPAPPKDTTAEIEDLHWALACERRRADATSKRARILLAENRALRENAIALAAHVTDGMFEAVPCPCCGSVDVDVFSRTGAHILGCQFWPTSEASPETEAGS